MNRRRIYWFCFKRQLIELYYLLSTENLVSCNIEEFTSHFTGKKWPEYPNKCNGKIKWYGGKSLLFLVVNYLTGKGFIDSSFSEHFTYGTDSKNQNGRRLINTLNLLLPEKTGYRCKTRLYYRERNKENIFKVLKKCGINKS